MYPRFIALAAIGVALLASCQLLVNEDALVIDNRPELHSGAGSVTATLGSVDCQRYCDQVLDACSGSDEAYLSTTEYASRDVCLAVCSYIPAGKPDEQNPEANTLACRRRNLQKAQALPLERSTYCPAAGPGGGA